MSKLPWLWIQDITSPSTLSKLQLTKFIFIIWCFQFSTGWTFNLILGNSISRNWLRVHHSNNKYLVIRFKTFYKASIFLKYFFSTIEMESFFSSIQYFYLSNSGSFWEAKLHLSFGPPYPSPPTLCWLHCSLTPIKKCDGLTFESFVLETRNLRPAELTHPQALALLLLHPRITDRCKGYMNG